ncbi:MAG TPA: AraC family transcriptional regulator [Polyangiaceae bacterium]|nr:AraC family transcriptional regulator [Polyangiaceae bacterium]
MARDYAGGVLSQAVLKLAGVGEGALSGLVELESLAERWLRREAPARQVWPGLNFVRAEQPGPMHKAAVHSLSLALVISGRKCARVDGREYHYDASHYFVLTSASVIEARVLEASPERPYLAMLVELPPAMVAKTLAALSQLDSDAPPVEDVPAYVARVDARLLDAACRFVRALETEADRRILAPLVLEEMGYLLLTSPHARALRRASLGVRDGQQILQAMEWMRAHTAEPLTVSSIARRAGMSASHFAHCFTELARVSPMRYLKRIRLEQAQALLLGSSTRASEVAQRVGYRSPSHFTRDFKAHFGVPPSQFAREFLGAR